MSRSSLFVVNCLFAVFLPMPVFAQEEIPVFTAGEEGYACYRIPAIVTTLEGTLLAFAEARRKNCGDAGDIDLVLKRSTNGGKTWSAMQVVWDDAGNTCGNPAPVVDRKTGKIVLLSTWNLGEDHEPQIIDGSSKDTRRIFVLNSTDDGASWSSPREITAQVKLPNWTWYATGPVNGIQMRSRPYRGRLVISCDHIEAGTKKYFSHAILSDDGGKTWQLGGTTPTDQVNECSVAELPGGMLMLNMRSYNGLRIRQVATSSDGGQSWSALSGDSTLVEPVCQGSLLWYDKKGRKPFLAFSNPSSQKSRSQMTVRISYDQGLTWPVKMLVHEGPSAYSNLAILPNGDLACYYEGGSKSPYEQILFKVVSVF